MKQNFKKLFCLLLTVTLLLPVLVSIPLTASAAGTFIVANSSVKAGIGTITYTGKNYKTGASGQSQTFDLNAGFLLSGNGTVYWGVCAYSGAKDPGADMSMGDLIPLNANGTYIDGLNNTGSGSHGSHYIVNSPRNDSTWGYGRGISMDFIFRCFYYANKLNDERALNGVSPVNCSLQEAIAIAYRYEWDVRLIPYGNTGTWNNSSKTWTVRDVNSWTKDTAHFGGVTDGNATHQAIVTAADQILVAAMQDADGISGHISTGTENGKNYLYYSLPNDDRCELRCIAGPARGQGKADYQDLFAYKPATFYETTGSIVIPKVNEHGEPLTRVYFGLYRDKACTSMISRKATVAADGVVSFTDLAPGTYYVKELRNLNSGYAKDETVYRASVVAGRTTTISNNANGKFVNYQNPTGSWTPTAKKQLSGGTLAANAFTFTLKQGNTVLQTVKNKADGSIPFTAIEYTADDIGKTYTYTVSEVETSDGKISTDGHALTYTVNVSYSGTGNTLTVTPSVEGDTTFVNYMPTGSFTPNVAKELTGRELQDGEFTFVLEKVREGLDNEVLQTVANKADGSIPFTAINYTLADVGTHTYTVKEVKGTDSSVVYDEHVITYTVTVSYTGTGTELTVETSIEGNTTFANDVPHATWKPTVTKKLLGRPLKDDEFTFVLEKDGEVLQTVKNKADGSIPFEELVYGAADIGKTYTYTVRELPGDDPTVAYDGHTVTYTVQITYEQVGGESGSDIAGMRVLKAAAFYGSGSTPTEPADTTSNTSISANAEGFHNKVSMPTPQTGDDSNLALWFGLGAVAIGGIIAVLVMYFKRKRYDE